CKPGSFGENCKKRCHCEVGGCNAITGKCINQSAGCKVPWTGESCSLQITCGKSFLHLVKSKIIHDIRDTYNFGDIVNISCNAGYVEHAKRTKCVGINKWSERGPVCEGVPCPDFNKTDNSELPTKLSGYRFQDAVTFKCNKGYILSGNASLICLANGLYSFGKWNSVQPVCTAENSSEFPAAIVGAAVGSSFAVILIVVIIVIIIIRRRKQEERTSKSTVYKETSSEFRKWREEKPIRSKTDITSSIITESKVTSSKNIDTPYYNDEDGEGYYSFTLDKQIPRSAILVKDFFEYVENGRETEGKIEGSVLKPSMAEGGGDVGFSFEEKKGDLFDCPETDALAHCVSEDLRMGKGIAVLFKKKFGGVGELISQGKTITVCSKHLLNDIINLVLL
ncbi:Hypothetical predicted protein, partial [Mytilus galloprovincialis]